MLLQILSVAGAALILGAFALLNTGRLRHQDKAYVLMNFVGASLLTWVAVADRRVGFIVLEASWALLSLLPLVRRPAAAPEP